MKLQRLFVKARHAVRSHGFRGALLWAWQVAWSRVVLTETHIWYELDLMSERPRRALQSGLSLRRGQVPDLSMLAELKTVSPGAARARLEGGNDLWLVLDGDQLLFSCWIFRSRAPVAAATGGEIELADAMVCLEDSVTTPAARGRGIGPAAAAAVADRLADEGQRRMVTKVTVDNLASRKAAVKMGFEPVAVMHFKRRGPLRRTTVRALDEQRGRYFVETLDPTTLERPPSAETTDRAPEQVGR
jgi:GNAT superfamily N-acetyltransferase